MTSVAVPSTSASAGQRGVVALALADVQAEALILERVGQFVCRTISLSASGVVPETIRSRLERGS